MYLYDDHFTLIINASKKPVSVDNIPLEGIEDAFNTDKTCTEQCSTMMSPAPAGGKERSGGAFEPACFVTYQSKILVRGKKRFPNLSEKSERFGKI